MSRPGPTRRFPARRAAVGVTLAAVLLLAACGSKDPLSGGKVVQDGEGCTVGEVPMRTDVPTVKAGTKVAKTVTKTDLIAAKPKACVADTTKYLTLDLVGATAADGKVFTSTWADKRPITARLGQSQLIAGLETGLTGMSVGARRQIVVPADQAYGKDGNKALGIGPDAALVFVVDLRSLTDAPVYCNKAQTPFPAATTPGKPDTVAMPVEAPQKLKATVLEPGDGATVTTKSYVTADYLGLACSTGAEFDSSWTSGTPITAALADATPTDTIRGVIPGWTTGLAGQKVGALVQIDIPSDEAYGSSSPTPAIGPNDPLTFVIRINASTEKAPDATTTTSTP